jgi:hypothetical protein
LGGKIPPTHNFCRSCFDLATRALERAHVMKTPPNATMEQLLEASAATIHSERQNHSIKVLIELRNKFC